MDFQRVQIDNKKYNCFNDLDVPFTCNGHGMNPNIIKEYIYSTPCPDNWLNKKYGGWLNDPTSPIKYSKSTNKLPQGSYYNNI